MKLTTVKEIYKEREKYLDKEVTVGGWVRSVRDSKTFGFIVLHDGSFFETLQVVYHDTMENFAEISKLNVGAAIIVKGTLVATPQAKQPFEIQAAEVTVEGNSAPDYPLQKKRHSRATEFKVNMGKPSFISSDIPVSGEVREVIKENFVFHGKEYKATCLTVGNPHCIIFTDNVSAEAVKNLGPYVENADEFPERMNLQICRQIDKGNLEIEIWERGSGYTKASGTGSCAAAAAAYKLGLVESRINVNQPGGMIQIDMEEDGTVYMTGTVGYIADISVAESFFS